MWLYNNFTNKSENYILFKFSEIQDKGGLLCMEVLMRNMFQNLGKNQSANVWFVMKNLLKK